jgi:hypothetical protein
VGAEESGAAKFGFGGAMLLDRLGPPGRCSGYWPHDGEVAGGAVAKTEYFPVRREIFPAIELKIPCSVE